MNNAAVGLFNATMISLPMWGLIYFAVRLLLG
jgi:hypothetical protein